MTMYFDFDDVLNNLRQCWVKKLNHQHGLAVNWADVREYDLRKSYPELSEYQIYLPYLEGTLYLDIAPVKAAQELIADLETAHEICIATTNLLGIPQTTLASYLWSGSPTKCMDYLLQFVTQYYPTIPQQNIMCVGRKDKLTGDVLIDDNPAHLLGFDGMRILLDKPYNRNFDTYSHGVERVFTYATIRKLLEEL